MRYLKLFEDKRYIDISREEYYKTTKNNKISSIEKKILIDKLRKIFNEENIQFAIYDWGIFIRFTLLSIIYDINITSIEDDYYYLLDNAGQYYKCDQFSGLVNFIKSRLSK